MSKVLRRDEVMEESRWLPETIELPELCSEAELEATALEIRRLAEEQAAELLAEAQRQAEALKAQAREEGYQDGRAQAVQEAQESVQAVDTLIEEINQERAEFFDRSEGELVRLVTAIAEKVLAQQLAVKPDTILDYTRTHIKRIRDRETVRLRVNPEDLPLLMQARPSFLGEIDGLRDLQMQEDRRVGRGGVILEAPSGTFDARYATQLETIREALEAGQQEESGEPQTD
ncbi:MAG: FliH/SctL family protein [Armatimonadota bacterium]